MHLLTTVEATALESSIYDAEECVSAKKIFLIGPSLCTIFL